MKHSLLCATAFVIVLINVFYSFPIMGHDYSLVISWANDYHFAWKKFSVFNVQFSPQRCLGIPVWANPIGVNFSLFHVLSAFFNDISVIVLFIGSYISLGYWGTVKFLKHFKVDNNWMYYLAFAWSLQGTIVSRTIVGHLSYLGYILWPFYSYLLLNDNHFIKTKKYVRDVLILGLLLAHDFYSGSVPVFVMFPVAFVLMLVMFKITNINVNYRHSLIKLCGALVVSAIIIAPKTLAIYSFTQNFQRSSSFINIGFLSGITFSFFTQLFPPVLDYKQMTGWWYGNWEALNYLFPGLLLIVLFLSLFRLKQNYRTVAGIIFIVVLGGLIASGIYADLIQALPIVKSFHVNPRWMIMLSLSTFVLILSFLKSGVISQKIIIPLIVFNALVPFYVKATQNFNMHYTYRMNLDVEKNRLQACYEPVFGYRLELFPVDDVVEGKPLDPRCYLVKGRCKSMVLPDDKIQDLKEYRLRPFD